MQFVISSRARKKSAQLQLHDRRKKKHSSGICRRKGGAISIRYIHTLQYDVKSRIAIQYHTSPYIDTYIHQATSTRPSPKSSSLMIPHKHHDLYSGKIGKEKGTTEKSTAHSIIHLRNIISCICCFDWKYLSSPPALLTYLAESKNDLTIERSYLLPYIAIAYCSSCSSSFVEGFKTKTKREPTGYKRSRPNERTNGIFSQFEQGPRTGFCCEATDVCITQPIIEWTNEEEARREIVRRVWAHTCEWVTEGREEKAGKNWPLLSISPCEDSRYWES